MKITQAPSLRATSSAVGVPKQDQSNVIIAQGAQQLASTAASVLQGRQDLSDALAARAKWGEFDRKLSFLRDDTYKQHLNKPQEYPAKVIEEAYKLKDSFLKELSPGAGKRFNELAVQHIAAQQSDYVSLAIRRQQEIDVFNSEQPFKDAALKAESILTPKEFIGVKAEILKQEQAVKGIVGEQTAYKWREGYIKMASQNHMATRLLTDPRKLYVELKGSQYKDILTPSEEVIYTNQAFTAMTGKLTQEQEHRIATAYVELNEYDDRVLNNDPTVIQELNQKIEWAEMNKGARDEIGNLLFPDTYVDTLKAIKNKALLLDSQTRKYVIEKEGPALYNGFHERWNSILKDKSAAKKRMTPKDDDEILDLYADIQSAYYQNKIDNKQYEALKTIMNHKIAYSISRGRNAKQTTSRTLNESLEQARKERRASWAFWDKDIYYSGYTKIYDYVEKQPVTPEEKGRLKERLLLDYTKFVKDQPDTWHNDLRDFDAAADKILNGYVASDTNKRVPGIIERTKVFKHPTIDRPLKIGDSITIGPSGQSYIVSHEDPKNPGVPILKVLTDPSKTKQALENR